MGVAPSGWACVAGASAALIASLDSKRLPVGAVEAADQVATSIKEALNKSPDLR